jgi:hypothetical protein
MGSDVVYSNVCGVTFIRDDKSYSTLRTVTPGPPKTSVKMCQSRRSHISHKTIIFMVFCSLTSKPWAQPAQG